MAGEHARGVWTEAGSSHLIATHKLKPNMPKEITIDVASVKVMRSHDYCHFEVCLSSSSANAPELVDEMRKTAARLADKAVEQYKVAKINVMAMARNKEERSWLEKEVAEILTKAEGDRTPNEMARVKALADWNFERRFDYQDDWQD